MSNISIIDKIENYKKNKSIELADEIINYLIDFIPVNEVKQRKKSNKSKIMEMSKEEREAFILKLKEEHENETLASLSDRYGIPIHTLRYYCVIKDQTSKKSLKNLKIPINIQDESTVSANPEE